MENDANKLPKAVVDYLSEFRLSKIEYKAEIEAYNQIKALIDNSRDKFSKRVHIETFETILKTPMKFSYCLEHVFDYALKEQRAAKRRTQPHRLFEEIEMIMASATQTENFGKSRRWPLKSNGGSYSRDLSVPRNQRRILESFLPLGILNSSYTFGVHHFYVGNVIERILRMIERRYGLDFKKLEMEYQKKIKSNAE